MTEHNPFDYPYASFTQLPFLKVTALYFDMLVILDPVGASNISERNFHADSVGAQGGRYGED